MTDPAPPGDVDARAADRGAPDRPAPDPVEAAIEAVERDHGVTVLAARDLGSHAWNLDDADSDRDPAVVFAQPAVDYATLDGYVESVDRTDGAVDLSGWNVRRFGELLVESNPTALEFLHSPVCYRGSTTVEALADDVGDRFVPIQLYHHYRSLAVGNATSRPTVKRALHVLRAVLYARYVHETHEFPDLDFPAFLDSEGDRFEDDLVEWCRGLVEHKRAGEGDTGAAVDLLDATDRLPDSVDTEPHAVRGVPADRVNEFIRAAVRDGPSGERS